MSAYRCLLTLSACGNCGACSACDERDTRDQEYADEQRDERASDDGRSE